MPQTLPEPIFFATPADFRAWLEANHATATELIAGFYRKGSGKPSMTWAEAVDEALCFGWIDGVRRRLNDEAFTNRFTPRRRGSIWSARNIGRVAELTAQGRMQPAGLAAFAARTEANTAVYSFEQAQEPALSEDQEAQLRANEAAWAYFSARPPGYRRTAIHWVVSARREETRRKRLATLIEDSANGRHIPLLRRAERG